MLAADWITLAEMFEHAAAIKRREDQAVVYIRQDIEKDQHKAEHREKEQAAQDHMAAEIQAQAAVSFSHKLDTYDTATVDALQDNERALHDVRARRQAMEDAAYTLPDGRKVFKSEDGHKVFDKAGAEVSRDVIDPESIPDVLARNEAHKAILKEEDGLVKTQDTLHQYQQQLDEARHRLDKGGMTPAEIAETDAALERARPDVVRQKLGEPLRQGIQPDAIQPEAVPALPDGPQGRRVNSMALDPRL